MAEGESRSRPRAWLDHRGHDDASFQCVTTALAAAGVELSPAPAGGGEAPAQGVVVFDAVSAELVDHVTHVSRRGMDRVLAVGTSAAAVAGDATWRLLSAGVSDVFAWDHSPTAGEEIAARLRRWEEVDRLVLSPLVRDNLVGNGAAWRAVLREVVEIARFTDASVLITGESGTGKELVARLIHTLDPRPDKGELVVLDCTTVVPSLSGSEFFGHDRGSFTGAVTTREGAFAMADGGTLFLDEVGELPLTLQAELLRVVQERMYKRVGSDKWRKTNFRLVCATNRDLLREADHGSFRRDFYYRIASWTCNLPPLRERTEDVLDIATHFLAKASPDGRAPALDPVVQEYLLRREYPGNVRDLRNLVVRTRYRHVGDGPITTGDIPADERPPHVALGHWRDDAFERGVRRALVMGATLKEISAAAAETAIRVALTEEAGNLQRASRRLGVTDRALQLRQAARRDRDGSRGGGGREVAVAHSGGA